MAADKSSKWWIVYAVVVIVGGPCVIFFYEMGSAGIQRCLPSAVSVRHLRGGVHARATTVPSCAGAVCAGETGVGDRGATGR